MHPRTVKMIAIPLVVVISTFIYMSRRSSSPSNEHLTAAVTRSDFTKTITVSGELRAKYSTVITAPAVRGELKILFLAPKGSEVEAGDTLVVFDSTEVLNTIEKRWSDWELAQSNLDKSHTTLSIKLDETEAQLQNAQASYELAQLQMKQVEFEAEVVRQERELSLRKAKTELDKAEKSVDQQKQINESEIHGLELAVQRTLREYNHSLAEKDKLTLTAPQKGLVVYKEMWRGKDSDEIKAGDVVWRGMPLMEIPDLSSMEAVTEVNELDISQIQLGQSATVVPDAFADREFTASVTEVARLAHQKNETHVKVFDTVLELDSCSTVLKPGMTVKCTILVEEISDTLLLPLDALFMLDNQRVVYIVGKHPKIIQPELGPSNSNSVVVLSGLTEGTIVSLSAPATSSTSNSELNTDNDSIHYSAIVGKDNP